MLAAAVLLIAADSLRADVADDQFAVAAGHYAAKRWKFATEEFRAFLDRHPDHPKAEQSMFLLGESLLQLSEYEQAGAAFHRYLDARPDGKFAKAALFRAGESAHLAGKTEAAKADLTRFHQKHSDDKLNAYVLTYLGEIALAEGNPTAAVEQFRRGLAEFPHGPLQDDCRFGLAQALESQATAAGQPLSPGSQNQLEEAENLYAAVAAKPAFTWRDQARFRLGIVRYTLGRYAESAETLGAFEADLSKGPWAAKARLTRGWALMKLGRNREAKALFDGLVANPETATDARFWLAAVQRIEEDWPSTAKTLLAAVDSTDPADERMPSLRFHAGDALRRAGDLKAAGEQFDRVIELKSAASQPPNAWIDDAVHGKMQIALGADDFQTLDRLAAEFDGRCPNSPLRNDVLRMAGQSRLKRKEYAEAVEFLEPLAADGKRDVQALSDRYLLALAYDGAKRPEDALALLLPVLDAAEGTLKADAQLAYGTILAGMGKWADAIEPLDAFLRTGPQGDPALKGRGTLAICYARTGRIDDARKCYAAILEDRPGHELLAPVTEQLAEAAYAAENRQWSTELFQRLGKQPGSAENEWKGLAGQAWSRFKAGEPAEAEALFEKLLAKNPPRETAAEATFVRGVILDQLNRPTDAMAMYRRVIDEYKDSRLHGQALLAAARLHARLERPAEAADLYQRLAEEYPDLARQDAVLYEWAWTLNDRGKEDEAIELFERLRREYAGTRYGTDAIFRLAERAFAAADYARADELLGEVLSGAPNDNLCENSLFLRARIAAALEKWPQVVGEFETLLTAFPETPSRTVAEFWIAEAAYRQKDYDAAAERFERLAGRTAGRKETWLGVVPLRRAQILNAQEKWSEAAALASTLQTDYPGFSQQYEADYLIGCCLQRRADFRGARAAFERVVGSAEGAKTETAAMAQWRIGETYFHQKDYTTAAREYLKVDILYDYPQWRAASLLQAGKCHQKLGEPGEATGCFRQVVALYPDTVFARQAAELLRDLEKEP
jgi:TolA-binding protein